MIKAILFDIDGVLADSRKCNYLFLQEFLKNLDLPFIDFDEYVKLYYHLNGRDIFRLLYKEKSTIEINNLYQKMLGTQYTYREMKLVVGLIEIIKLLNKKHILSIVTGRPRIGAIRFLKYARILNYFKEVITYDDYSKPKPDPEPILLALRKLNLKPEEAIYVGDSLTDLQAAQAIKMKFIGFYGISGKIFKEADANVKNFKELEEAILTLK